MPVKEIKSSMDISYRLWAPLIVLTAQVICIFFLVYEVIKPMTSRLIHSSEMFHKTEPNSHLAQNVIWQV